jgi:translation elongation factor EF-G
MSSPELCLTVQERDRLRECQNVQTYVQEHRKILKAKSKQLGFGNLERILYLVDNGILIRSCQLLQKQEVLYSDSNITETVDGISLPPGRFAKHADGVESGNIYLFQGVSGVLRPTTSEIHRRGMTVHV